MDIQNKNNIEIVSLLNEMLLFIFNKLNTIDGLYSLVDVNQRFNQLLLDSRYIYNLNFTVQSLFNNTSSTSNKVFNRICEKILPRINLKIRKLTIEPIFMKHVLSIIDYLQLNS